MSENAEVPKPGTWWEGLPGGIHRLRDEEKLVLHEAIATRLAADPDRVLAIARANIARWLEHDANHKPYFQEWSAILDSRIVAEIIELITADTEEGRRLRQTAPFVGVVSQAERAEAFAAARVSPPASRRTSLGRLADTWGLTPAEVARLMRCSVSSLRRWRREGVPAARAPDVTDLADATARLERYVRRELIPEVVRRPAPTLDGRSIYELACAGRYPELREAVRRIFDIGEEPGR